MEAFPWQDRYNTGVERIDHQHRYFLRLINELSSRLRASGGDDIKHRHIEEVMRYATFHFLSEENLMVDHGYPGWEAHQAMHSRLVNELMVQVGQLELGKVDALLLVDFLRRWFLEHTVQEDAKLGVFLRRQRLGAVMSDE